MPVKERRAHPRFPVNGIDGAIVLVANARILNISRGGMAVETSTRLALRQQYMVRLGAGKHERQRAASIVRCILVGTRRSEGGDIEPVYEAGIRFEVPIPSSEEAWLTQVGEPEEGDAGKRAFGRFRPRDETNVELGTEHPVQLEKISEGGLQSRGELFVEPDTILDLDVDLAGATLQARGRVAFVEPITEDGEAQGCRLGIQFLSLDRQSRKALDRFISALAREAGEPT